MTTPNEAGRGRMHELAVDHLALALAAPARISIDKPLETYLRLMGFMPELKSSKPLPEGQSFDAVMARLVASYGQEDAEGFARATGRSVATMRVWKSRGSVPKAVLLEACVKRGINFEWLMAGATA